MKNKQSDLLSIANADLSDRLNQQDDDHTRNDSSSESRLSTTLELKSTPYPKNLSSFKKDIWKAVYILNLMRYLLAILFICVVPLNIYKPEFMMLTPIMYVNLFLVSACMVLISAICFSYLSNRRLIPFRILIITQLTLDVILATLITHSTGSITSHYSVLYFLIVSTGSVILPRFYALGLASGAVIFMFYEHIYSVLISNANISPSYTIMVWYGMVLFIVAWIISYLAQRLRHAELTHYVPGEETLDDFLMREEMDALKAALIKTGGNKTKAAKLLGTSFRSFRYKLSKYGID